MTSADGAVGDSTGLRVQGPGGTELLRTAVLADVDAALSMLRGRRLPPDAVHAVRRSLKRARAYLRMLRPCLSRASLVRENRALRGVGLALGAVRDADVALKALDRFRKRLGPAASALAPLRRSLADERRAAAAALCSAEGGLAALRAALRESHARIGRWRFDAADPGCLLEGLRQLYGRGRRRLAAARSHRSTAALHAWRRQVKNYGYALRWLEPLRPAYLGARLGEAETLGDRLGEEHDLAGLARRLAAADLPSPLRRRLGRQLAARRAVLVEQSLASGERLYAESPRRLERRFRRYARRPGS
jgi:CHAD domain-containing protein